MTAESSPTRSLTTLNAFDIACVVIGGIIGVGIFFAPAKVAAVCDSPFQVMAAWSLGGAMALLGAFVYARLSQLAPGPGGVLEYLRLAFGPLPAFLYGWCNLLVVQSGALAVIGLVMASNLEQAFALGELGEAGRVAVGTGAIGLLTLINLVGLRFGKRVQVVLTVLKTTAVFAIVAVAIWADPVAPIAVDPAAAPRPPVGFWTAMTAAILPVLFACGGWQQGSFVAAVARRPVRDVPIGLVVGVAVVVIAYLTVNLAYLDLLGFAGAAASEAIGVDAVRAAFGEGSGEVISRIFAAVIVVSALGIMNTICMAPPYVLHAMARRGLFFRSVGVLHRSFGTPFRAILIQGVWATTLLWGTQVLAWSVNAVPDGADPLPPHLRLDPLGFLLDGVVVVDWMFYGAVGVGLLVLLRRRPVLTTGDRCYAVAGVLFTCSALFVTLGSLIREVSAARSYPSLGGLAVVLLGFGAYRLCRGSSSSAD